MAIKRCFKSFVLITIIRTINEYARTMEVREGTRDGFLT